jgi:hypothetical protein
MNVVDVEACLAPDAEGAQLVIHGDRSEVVTVNLCREAVLCMSALIDQIALEMEAAQLMAGTAAAARASPLPAREIPVVTPVHLAEELKTFCLPGNGCLLEVKALLGGHLRISLEAEQVSSLLSELLARGARKVQ